MADPYETHLPVLEAFANLLSPKAVLEFGAGDYSTPFFLSLPIDRLVSIEIKAKWRQRINDRYADKRLTVQGTPLLLPPLTEFDLILIDDGEGPDERERTIRYVLAQPHPPVVIHDAEVPAYRNAIRELAEGRSMLFCLQTPYTALVWPKGWEQNRHALGKEVARCACS